MKTKEEILKQYHVPITKGINVIAEIDALDAMEEYANQVKPEWVELVDERVIPAYHGWAIAIDKAHNLPNLVTLERIRHYPFLFSKFMEFEVPPR